MFREFLMKPNGDLYKEGDILRDPVMAYTLERIANHGGDELYTGSLADDLIQDLKDHGKHKYTTSWTQFSFAGYKFMWEHSGVIY